ncbi:integrin beta-like protein 1 [Meles meles]|uniref:integrin beta-like protein 1 n=1 Tax=Meles meles TaxID=9662 RepID=UPI001E69D7A0|nr:integrin beta-like protein 1 [Meles meles]
MGEGSTPPRAVPLPKSSPAAHPGAPGSLQRPDLHAVVSVCPSAGGLRVAPLPAAPSPPPHRESHPAGAPLACTAQELSMRPAAFSNFLLLASSLLFAGLSAVPQSFSPSLRSGTGAACRLTRAESERRCRAPGQPPGGVLCHGRGRCDCGVCICHVTEPGVYFGPLCECHDWVCETYDGSTCAGHGKCDCGKCKCQEGWFGDACQYPTHCDLTKKKSNQMCKNSQDVICSNAGTCHCGRCKCDNPDGNGLVYGKFCECDDRECIDDETEEMCGGHGKCYCGNCYCGAGWHGDKCELQCDISPWESKRRCTSPDGKICSNRGTCVCGECSCHDVDPTGDWGDIHGDTCECDERDCRAVYDRYSDDFCSGHGQCNCGRCDCKVGWYGRKCEHPRSCPLSAEESIRKCQGNSALPCSGRETTFINGDGGGFYAKGSGAECKRGHPVQAVPQGSQALPTTRPAAITSCRAPPLLDTHRCAVAGVLLPQTLSLLSPSRSKALANSVCCVPLLSTRT